MVKQKTHPSGSATILWYLLIFISSIQWSSAQKLVPEKPSAINQKLATEIQTVIDLLDPFSDADKILSLKRTKDHVEAHLNKNPDKNLDQAIQNAFLEEQESQWVKNLVEGWRVSTGLISSSTNDPGTALPPGSRISELKFEPIFYLAGPEIPPYTEAYLTLEIQSQIQREYASIRISNPASPDNYIFIDNVFLLPQQTTSTESYLLDVSAFGPIYDHILCEISISTTPVTEEQFVAQQSILLLPSHCVYFVPSGVPDEVDGLMQVAPGVGEEKRFDEDGFRYVRRGDDLPNIDLDGSRFYPKGPFSPPGQGRGHNRARSGQPPSDINACVPAATANSMYWLGKKHPELAKLKNSLRANLDLLKRLMRMNEKRDGVMVKDFIQGKLTFVDSLKLPIKVKYQSVHKAANPDSPLKSEAAPYSTATNHGKEGAYPDIKWLMKEIDEDEDVEVNFGYYYPQPDGSLVRRGGHSTVVDGYVTDGEKVHIYLKEDNDQTGPGGTRTIAYAWVLDGNGRPVLSRALGNMKNMANTRKGSAGQRVPADDEPKRKGPSPIKIVETVVSESFDPTMKNPESSSMITPPWDEIDLTASSMKLGYPFVVKDGGFPWVPVAVGVVSVGTLTYFLTKDDDTGPDDCSFTTTAQTISSTCGLTNGGASVITNPPGDYTYVWSNGATTSTIGEVPAGMYTVTVSRTGTTCSETLTVNISNTNPTFDASISTTNADCGQNNGSAMVTVTPASTYTYQWSNGSTAQNQTALTAGQYSLTISAGGECVNNYAVQIGETPFDPTINITSTSSSCGQADGTATATVEPAGDYIYAWSNGQSGAEATGLAAGDYTVSVSVPGTNCTATTTFTVDELPAGHTVSVTTTSSGCGLNDGTATATVDPPGDYTYAWSNGQSGPEASGLAAGDYTVSVSVPGTNCTATTTFTLDELPAGHTVSVTTTSSGCGLNDGTATATVDPPGDYTYAWSNGQSGPEATGLAAGEYTVSVSISGSNCTQTTTFTVDELPAGHTVNVTTTSSGCGLTDGTATATVDPPGDYTYAWSNGQSGPEATGLAAGEYTVSVSVPGTNCTATTTFTVDELPAGHTVNVTTTSSGCGLNDGTATATVDPPGDYTYAWSNGQSGPEATGLAAGQYTVSVSVPGSSCLVVQDFIIDQTSGNFTGTITTDDSSCGLADGTATATIDPPGEYIYEWSNGQTGSVADMLSPGTYTLIVTDTNQCAVEFSVTVGQDTAEFITIVSTTPGTCVGGGEITFTLTTPGNGPIVFQADGPNGTTSQTLSPGTYQLSAFFPVSSGSYTLNAYDQVIGADCIETVMIDVVDNTPDLIADDDFYETPGGTPVSGNALDNDEGLAIEMTSVSDEFGGSVTFLPSGDFDFTPDPGFSGEATFVYTVTDACGTTTTAVVTILVATSVCDFTTSFEFIPASCGLDDGAITVEVNEPGDYDYLWSNGDSGPSISALFAGSYTVTIMDINLGCELDFTVDLPENPAEHIDDVVVTQPACGVEGEIQFTVSSSSQNPLVMSVDHPNGSDLFFIAPGVILLSDFVSLTSGDYIIEVFDVSAGPDCSELLEVTLVASSSIEIFAEAVVPPTEPTAMDGFAIIVAIVPGTLPYEILLNGSSWGVAIDHTFEVGGLEVGEYTIQLIDAEGCVSNILLIVVPFPDIIMSFGTSILQTIPDASNEMPAIHESAMLWRTTFTASMQYGFGNIRQEVLTRYALPTGRLPGFAEIAYMTDIGRYTFKGVGLALQGGLGSHFEQRDDRIADHHTLPRYVLLRASSGYTIARRFRLQGSLEMRGWEKFERPRVEIGLSIPVVRNEFRWVK